MVFTWGTVPRVLKPVLRQRKLWGAGTPLRLTVTVAHDSEHQVCARDCANCFSKLY